MVVIESHRRRNPARFVASIKAGDLSPEKSKNGPEMTECTHKNASLIKANGIFSTKAGFQTMNGDFFTLNGDKTLFKVKFLHTVLD